MLNVVGLCRGRHCRCGYIYYGEFANKQGQQPLYVISNTLYNVSLCYVHSNNSRLSESLMTMYKVSVLTLSVVALRTQHLSMFRTTGVVLIGLYVKYDYPYRVQLRHIKEETNFRVCPFSIKFAYLVYRETLKIRYQIGELHEDCDESRYPSAKVSGGFHNCLGLVRLVTIDHPVYLTNDICLRIRSPCCRNTSYEWFICIICTTLLISPRDFIQLECILCINSHNMCCRTS